ncbi:PREDICTED: radial spoke head 14 homolog [Poecilia mexicana]|uniref:radial spoke head 14 homolog n=1 Tax=Poecilia mexicana TaxID=48701 RepID=UPI00072EB632|nr:PREDICTED: radial spoke head 14 homolog [Poecilia mexicana]
MTTPVMDPNRAPVAFGRRAVPQLFEQLQVQDPAHKVRALTSLCDLVHEPERLYQTVTGGFLKQLQVLLQDDDAAVRSKTCELLHLVMNHSIGRSALLASGLLPSLSHLMDDPSTSCRTNVHRVLSGLAQLPAGAEALLSLVPKLMLKLRHLEEVRREKQEEEQELLLSTLTSCSRLDPLPALASDGVPILGQTLTHTSPSIRREAAAALMALSVPGDGKQQVCDHGILSTLLPLLHDRNLDVQTNAAGVIMNTVIIRPGKYLCLELDVIPVLLRLLSEEEDEERKKRRKTLVIYCLRALTGLSEAPEGRVILSNELPLLERRSNEQDEDVRRAAQTAIKVVTWKP